MNNCFGVEMVVPKPESQQTVAKMAPKALQPCQTSQTPTASQLFREKIHQGPILGVDMSLLYTSLLIQVFPLEMQVAEIKRKTILPLEKNKTLCGREWKSSELKTESWFSFFLIKVKKKI